MTGMMKADKKEYRVKNKIFCYALIFLALFVSANPVFAQRRAITINLASLVPENTPWGSAINRMAADWERATNGEVQVIVFHNATPGTSRKFCASSGLTAYRRLFLPALE